jgi:hypothetical protein
MNLDNMDRAERKRYYMRVGMAIGMATFAPAGIALALMVKNPGLLGIGPAMGIGFGIAIGVSIFQRNENRANRTDSQDESN